MRKSLVILSVAAAVGLSTAGVAAAEPPPPAEGIAVALDGTTLDGEAVPVSQALVDPALATCFDLVAQDGRPAVWKDFVNRTDRVAGLSTRTCAEIAAGDLGRQQNLQPGEADPTADAPGYAWRSATFLSIP
jgi:hypothetical protein